MNERERYITKEISRLEAENELLRKRIKMMDKLYREQFARFERLSNYCADLEWLREWEHRSLRETG